jgi:hypothetical protein
VGSFSWSSGYLAFARDFSCGNGFRRRALGVLSVPLPAVETGIALSGVILGLMVALAAKPPLRIAGAIVGLFAIFHGHAHGTELPAAANAVTYAARFVIATGLLHLSGIALGLLARWPWGEVAVRAGGAVTAAVGVRFSVPFAVRMGRSNRRRSLLLLATLVFSLCLPAAARAHSTIQGLEDLAGALFTL